MKDLEVAKKEKKGWVFLSEKSIKNVRIIKKMKCYGKTTYKKFIY